MTNLTDEARALAHECHDLALSLAQAKHIDYATPASAAIVLRDLTTALAAAEADASAARERVRELAWWQNEADQLRRQCKVLQRQISALVDHQVAREIALEKRHQSEIADMRAMVEGYRAALSRQEHPDA